MSYGVHVHDTGTIQQYYSTYNMRLHHNTRYNTVHNVSTYYNKFLR